MSHPSRHHDPEPGFASLYESLYPDLLRFVQRRAHRDHAEDVVADTFLVVWRRFDELPRERDDQRGWAFGIARNMLLNDQRGTERRRALGVRLADASALRWGPSPADPDADLVVGRIDLARAWECLSPVHQEALALTVFEDMGAPQAAAVLDISPVAFRLRLSRARRALRLHLDRLSPSDTSSVAPERTLQP